MVKKMVMSLKYTEGNGCQYHVKELAFEQEINASQLPV
jgi:hypothetical protein